MAKRPTSTLDSTAFASGDAVAAPDSRRHRAWMIVAAVLGVGGLVGAFIGARSIARNDAETSRQEFLSSSAEIASTLQLAIQREEDLTVSAGAFLSENPRATNAEFDAWASSIRVLERYPEIDGIGYAVIVPAYDLEAFAAQAVADPAGPLAPDGSFQVSPPGERPFYCLIAGGLGQPDAATLPAGLDLCALGVVDPLATRDSGLGSYLPFTVGDSPSLSVQIPVYRGGGVPATVSARREQFVGWVGLTLAPSVVMERATREHPGLAVTMRYQDQLSSASFSDGAVPPGAASHAVDLHNGWTIETHGEVAGAGILDDGTALLLLAAGVALSLLVAALIAVLGTGRARALRLVRQRTGELRHQALHDALTGLPNRALIMDRIEQMLVRNRRRGTVGAALFVDLDDFKDVNDTLGHDAGDRLLVAVAARLNGALRDADTIGRMGGDEFVVLIDGASVDVAPHLVAERLLDVMRQPFELDGAAAPLLVNTSIGVAIGDRPSPGELLRDADVALYRAKAAGKNCYEVFHPEMQSEVARRIELESNLRCALERDEFRVVYQPIYNLEDLTLVGVEALLRWDHPTYGLVQPAEFIPILEQTGQIREVGAWVLRAACRQMADWQARGDDLDISVNVSARQLDDDAILDHIRAALDESGLDASSLIIEVTETALMENPRDTAARLGVIKQLGVRIAVDDFGTGYSSFAYLQQFPVDCLKIDRMFTSAMSTSPASKALVGTLVQLGRDLGLKTLAEGVETTDEIDLLRDEQVSEAQGFLLARPLDPDALEAQLLAPARPATESNLPS